MQMLCGLHHFHIMLFENLQVFVLLLLLFPDRRCLLQRRGSKIYRTENLALNVVDL